MLIVNSSNLTRAEINPFQRHPYIIVLGSIPQLLSSGLPYINNLLRASLKPPLEVREVFCANSIKDFTKAGDWLQLCQKTHFLQNKSCNLFLHRTHTTHPLN